MLYNFHEIIMKTYKSLDLNMYGLAYEYKSKNINFNDYWKTS